MSVKVLGVFKAATATRDVPAGAVIFEAGAVVVDADETFGEMALVDTSARSATAVAVEDTKLAVIDKRRFLFLVGETPTFALQVMSSLAERLRAMQAEA